MLHHPTYRTKFSDCLKRELPRIPLCEDFSGFAQAGRELAQLHLEYEDLEEYPLQWVESDGLPLSYRFEKKMKLSRDRTSLSGNRSLTLAGIPPEVFEYRLGNRSALEWVIDQYHVIKRFVSQKYFCLLPRQLVQVNVPAGYNYSDFFAFEDFGMFQDCAEWDCA